MSRSEPRRSAGLDAAHAQWQDAHPPHDASGHTWHHSDRQLLRIIKEGLAVIAPGYETDMPAFGDTLSDGEILAVLEYIKSTWPDREREMQAKRTTADPE